MTNSRFVFFLGTAIIMLSAIGVIVGAALDIPKTWISVTIPFILIGGALQARAAYLYIKHTSSASDPK